MRAVPLMLVLLLAALLTAGCISSIGSSTPDYTSYYVSTLKSVPVADSATAVTCKGANCVCMVCKTGQSFFSFLGISSFAGGNCSFIGINDSTNQCTSTVFGQLINGTSPLGSNAAVNYFRIGQGPSFSDFAAANKYCDNRLGMAVQWLVGSPGNPYSLPAASRAVCMLDKGVIPVYILYSNGTDINITQTLNIATILGTQGGSVTGGRLPGPVGPVVVTTEMNYNVSEAPQIKQQIMAINQGCGNNRDPNHLVINCLVAVAPRLGDFAALNAVMDDPQISPYVDLVAYGIDSDTMNLSGQCNTPSAPWQAAINFSSYSLYTLGKPSIIPYVLFDGPGSTDASGTCTWTEGTMTSDYGIFFTNYFHTLYGIGVIGVAPYAYNSTLPDSNPLRCIDCSIGSDQARMASWFGNCQAEVNLSLTASTGVNNYPSPGELMRFADQPSGSCQDDSSNIASEIDNRNYAYGDFTNPVQPTLQANSTPTLFSCDACVSDTTGSSPFAFPAPSPSNTPSPTTLAAFCTDNPELDSFAGQHSLDPEYVRAVAATESGFNPCAVAKVHSGDACYSSAYVSMSDPSGQCPASDFSTAGGVRFCGLGLMQSLEPPLNGPYWSNVPSGLAADLPLAQSCDSTNFNPFNATDSECVGTAKLAQKLQIAQAKVAQYHAMPGANGPVNMLDWPATAVNNDSVFAAYIAANLYVGAWNDSWITAPSDSYYDSWTVTDAYCSSHAHSPVCSGNTPNQAKCYGITDPVVFIQCKINQRPHVSWYPSPAVGDVGATKMWYYFALKNTGACNSPCPDWLSLYNYAASKYQQAGQQMPALPADEDPDVAG
jgi:hypothetical protein